MKLNAEQRAALIRIVQLQIDLWEAGSDAEELFDCDITTRSEDLDEFAACIIGPIELHRATDAALSLAFDLD